ncbi:Putative protein similar to GRAM domain-containing protein YSP2 of Saccharomyces cerevisiae [Podospora comata]|uniref:VASt domain-containing protein n=1 Tax=Podospora comata TaxID=48703 RepID=A0ABY6RZT4_PODCO|nr:Putative protein similar to GRAM domain-containing protein YSP2 of Saccharomyces cerevisiae [Podospora comata]
MDGTSNGLGKLLPKAIAAKRRRNKASSIYSSTSNDDVAPHRGTDNSNAPVGETSSLRRTDSQLSEDNTDLISFESDTASPDTRPTAISVHPSQIGHLTTSSPLVREKYKPESQTSDVLSSEISGLSTRSSTLPQDSSDSLESTPSLRKSRTHNLLHPDSDPPKRSTSGNRLRDVFRSKRGSEKSSSDEKTVPESSPAANPESEAKVSTSRNRALSRGPTLEPLKAPPRTPQTPSHGEPTPPVIVNTPPTPTDPQLPVIVATSSSPRRPANASPVGNMITQRRRAGSNAGPSKLSTITSAPLTPTPEAGPVSPNPAATFFSSMFSAVQNTANSLSSTISTANLAPGTKSRAGTPSQETDSTQQQQQQQDGVEVESSSIPDLSSESKEPAVKTLGMGDLSLSQLGISETPSNAPSPVASKFADPDPRNRSDSAPDPLPAVTEIVDESHLSRPRSVYSANGDRTPPAGSVYEGRSGVHRSGSIRSALGHRRKRGSSIATHNTSGSAIGAAISAANSSVANPNAAGSTPKLTGFAVATKKRNRDFHNLFKSVPDDDYLIEDYSCALQREILAHGRLYISEGHLCFSSNILGWVTTLVMSFDEIVSVEKRSTALVFKNGLEISTLHAKHIFASFASRDTTYDLIIKIWKLGHPHLQSSLNGVRLEEPGGDRTEKVDVENVSVAGSQSISGSDDESADGDDDDDDVYDEDEEEEDSQEASLPADATSEGPDKTATRKVSGPVPSEKADDNAPTSGGDFPGPTSHAPTECGDEGTHYEKILGDETIPAPLGKVYNLLFGPGSAAWMGKFLTVDQKCLDLQMEDKRGLTGEVKSRTFTYIKPLNASIGPKQTKCIVTEQLESIDLDKSVNVLCSTQNPDVPSGNIFVVKTKYCLTWGENNGTRVQINCTIEWSGKSWLKGPIEKGANEGQTQYCKDLFASLRAAISSRPRSSTLGIAAGARGKKRGRKAKSALASNQASDVESVAKVSVKESWGLLEPVRPFLGPVFDIIRPILTGNVVYGLLVGLLVASWFGFGTRQGPVPYGRDIGFANYPQRIAAYEEMWSREESELWEWIEERAGLDRLNGGSMPAPRKRTVDPRTVEEKLREERMAERELREAIRVTEEHLQVLKSVVNRKERGEKATSD